MLSAETWSLWWCQYVNMLMQQYVLKNSEGTACLAFWDIKYNLSVGTHNFMPISCHFPWMKGRVFISWLISNFGRLSSVYRYKDINNIAKQHTYVCKHCRCICCVPYTYFIPYTFVWYIPYAYVHNYGMIVLVWYGYLYHMFMANILLLFTSNI